MATLVGDRFVRMPGGWLDLVTARAVDVRIGPQPADVPARGRRCEAQLRTLVHGGPQLVDFGRLGLDGWFEAVEPRLEISDTLALPLSFSLKRLMRPAIARIEAVAAEPMLRGVRHVQLVAPPHSGCGVAVQDLSRALRGLGFIALRADLAVPADVRRMISHRHVVLLVMTPGAAAAGARWAARLAAASDRGHLLIERVHDRTSGATPHLPTVVRLEPCESRDLIASYIPGSVALTPDAVGAAAVASGGWPGQFALEVARRYADLVAPGIARERATLTVEMPADSVWPFSMSLRRGAVGQPEPPARWVSRAESCHRRGRGADGDRWLAAGLEASRRRADRAAVQNLVEQWIPRLIEAGRWQRAADVAMRALSGAIDPALRATAARGAAAAHLEAGHVSRADTCIDTALCIEQLILGHPTDATTAVRAAIRFWQGRWREGRQALEELPVDRLSTPLVATWRELLAWAEDDPQRQRWMRAETDTPDGPWPFAVRVFRAAASGKASEVRSELSRGPGAGNAWRSVIAAQAWLELGDAAAAESEIARSAMRPIAARGLADSAAASIRRALGVSSEEERRWLDGVTSRERLRGIVRWGQGRSGMQMLRDVSELLEIVQACEDEAAGLRQVCAWAAASANATACAIVSAPAGDVVAGAALAEMRVDRAQVLTWLDRPSVALDEGETEAHARAPIRYGGSTVGLVLGLAVPARARVLLEAVQAVGAVSGAMLRARIDGQAMAARGDLLAREILGTSPAIEALRAAAGRAAMAPFPVVIEGESGTGKELVARALHRLGPRRDRVFAALNCAALTDELVEAELFGHARGAFTHAVNARAGLFEEAHQGTLFLDEVGDLSPRAQAKLLRAVQEGEIRRVGENEARAVDVRVVAATNRPLAALVAAGRFRDDLMFRLSVIRIQVPPLRDRAVDVPALALAFWRQSARRVGTRAVLGPDALVFLAGLPWPGNVRELQNAMAAIAVAAPVTGRVGGRLVRQVLNGMMAVPGAEAEILPLDEARRQVERRLVSAALAKHAGSRLAAAGALGLSRQGLSKAMRRLGLGEAGVA